MKSTTRAFGAALLGATLLVAGPAFAQQPAPANPLDAVPDKMPFDVPYGAPISLERAEAAIAAAIAEAKKKDWKMNVAVVDSGGNLVAFQRMDGAQLSSIQIAEHKAQASAKFRRETKAFENGIQLSNFNYLITLDGVIASRGGIPLVENGKLIGAIGCSGGTGSQDEVSCKAGAALFK
jgi:glc operon protein GlcG